MLRRVAATAVQRRGWTDFAPASPLLRAPDVTAGADGAQRAWQHALERGDAPPLAPDQMSMAAAHMCFLACHPPLGQVRGSEESRAAAIFRSAAPLLQAQLACAAPRELGLVLWAYTVGVPDAAAQKDGLIDALLAAVLAQTERFHAAEFVDMLLAFSLSFQDDVAASVAGRRPHGVPGLLGARGRASPPPPSARMREVARLFDAFESQCLAHLDDLSVTSVVYCITAYVNAGIDAPDVFAAAVARLAVVIRAGECDPCDLPLVVVSLAFAGCPAADVFAAAAAAAVPAAGSWGPEELSTFVGAFRHTDQTEHGAMLDAAADAAMQLDLTTFPPSSLTTLTYALAKGGFCGDVYFDAAAEVAATQLDAFTPHEIAHLLTAYVIIDHVPAHLFAETVHALPDRLATFDSASITLLVGAYASLEYDSPELFDAVAAHVRPRLASFVPADMNILVWAFCKSAHATPELLEDVAHNVSSRLPLFAPQELSNMARWYAFAGFSAPEHWPGGYWTQKDGTFAPPHLH